MNRLSSLPLLVALLALVALAGCAADGTTASPGSTAKAPAEEPVTGSRLPPPKSRTP